MKATLLLTAALLCLAFTTNALPQRPEPRTFCRIAHVLAYNDELNLAMVAVGPYLPDSVMMMTLTLASMPAPSYPGSIICAQPRMEPEP